MDPAETDPDGARPWERAGLPSWFQERCAAFARAAFLRDALATSEYLTGAQGHLYDTYAKFNAQSQAVFLFALGALALAGALLGFVPDAGSAGTRGALILGAGGALLLVLPLVWLAMLNMRERYRTYVAAVLHAAYCHYAAGVPCHPWFQWVEHYMAKRDFADEAAFEDFWIDAWPNSYLPYLWAGRLLGLLAAVVGVGLLVLGGNTLAGA